MSGIISLDQALKNMAELENHPYGTPEEKKQRNKEANIAACGTTFSRNLQQKNSYSINWDGNQQIITIKCKYYRECEPCRYEKFSNEVELRLSYAHNHLPLGDNLRFDTITDDERGAFTKKLKRGGYDYYCFPRPNNELLIIHNDPDGSGDELWDYGYDDHDLYNEDNGFDLNFYVILKEVPEGKKISGNLGKKPEEEEEEGQGSGEQEKETFSIKKPFLFKEGLSERDAGIAYREALAKTQNINVEDEIDLEKALFTRINAMADEIDGAITGFTWSAVTEDEIKLWNDNPNNFSKSNVQITTNKESISSNLDISVDPNRKLSSFEAMKQRANRDDGMDSERQQALEDYLRYHGT